MSTKQFNWYSVKNADTVAAPAFAAMQVTGTDAATGALTVTRPASDGVNADVLFNGLTNVPAGGFGSAYQAAVASALYDAADGTPAAGETWGCATGRWELRKGKAGFTVKDAPAAGAATVNVMSAGTPGPAGTPGGTIAVNTVNPGTGDTGATVSGVSVVQIDQAGGLKEVNVGGGTVTVSAQAASATHAGAVSLSDQILGAGQKTVRGNNITIDKDANNRTFLTTQSTGYGGAYSNVFSVDCYIANTAAAAFGISGTVGGGGQTEFVVNGSFTSGVQLADNICYSLVRGITLYRGLTGTLGAGAVTTGGIITTLGTAGITFTAGYNKSAGGTGTLVFTNGVLTSQT